MSEIKPTLDGKLELEAMANALERSGAYRVLRRLEPPRKRALPDLSQTRIGLIVDVETTGLDPVNDEIIELAMVQFKYGIDGEIYEVGEIFEGLRQPDHSIPANVSAITGITDDMVAGKSIDIEFVSSFTNSADLIIAHNSAFDRKFLERFSPKFRSKAWGCSMSEIDWANEGYEGTKLSYLAASAGFFYERHRAVHDCMATLALLARTLPVSRQTGLSQLLKRARAASYRIWAENAPFELKEVLKARGYRWNGNNNGGPRAWYIDVPENARDAEVDFLKVVIFGGEKVLPTRRLTAYDRYSERY